MYDKITGPNQINLNCTNAYIFIMPKSGTVFLSIFFDVYADLLRGVNPNPHNFGIVYSDKHIFRKRFFGVNHSECPGYNYVETDSKMLAKWNNLSYYTSGWIGNIHINKRLGKLMDQSVSSSLLVANNMKALEEHKIVAVFRNPLDQMCSYYRHQWHSFTDDHHYKTGKNGASISLEEFIFKEDGIGSYIKQLYTFKTVGNKYPNLILFVPYEELMQNKKEAIRRIINHLGLPYNEKALIKAIELTSIENMRAEEDIRGISLGRDQSIASERHVRNGGIGTWQSQMTPDMVRRIEERLNEYDLSLKMFFLAEQIKPEFKFIFGSISIRKPRP